MKELPVSQSENWYGKNGVASKRLLYEIKWMKEYFKTGTWHEIPTPRTNWDKKFSIFPRDVRFHHINDQNFPLGWYLRFSMNDKGFLCSPNQVWTVRFFYPSNYPYAEPVTSLVDSNNYVIMGGCSRGTHFIEGITYNHACLYTSHVHDPANHHAALYMVRSIEWLRSYLYSQKHGVSMPFYV